MKRIYFFRVFQALLVFSLAFTLTNCGNLDNPLEELSGGGSGGSGDGGGSSTINATDIKLDQTTLSMQVGDKGQLTATVAPDNATDKTVTWSSDKEEIATVDANGLVTAVAMGTAIITAKAGDKKATCEVTVTANPAAVPLTLEVLEAGTIIVLNPKAGMQYSLNGGAKTAVPAGTAINGGDLSVGTKVEFYGNGTSITKYSGTQITGGTAEVKVYGNIMSLVDETGFATLPEPIALTSTFTFDGLFAGLNSSNPNTTLKDASGLLLPATTLTKYCYQNMFMYCTALTAVPELKATTLAEGCYGHMFNGCANLTTAPKLKATTLAEGCYLDMFGNCTQLTTAPELKATTLVKNCYKSMFNGCANLNSVTCLATDISGDYCTYYWLHGVSGTGTFTKASGMDWSGKTGSDGIPSGWTVNEQ